MDWTMGGVAGVIVVAVMMLGEQGLGQVPPPPDEKQMTPWPMALGANARGS